MHRNAIFWAIALFSFLMTPVAGHAFKAQDGSLGILGMVAKSDDVCSSLNGKSTLSDHEISATCTPGDTLLCSCEITTQWGNSKYKNCSEFETGDSGRVECTCNDDGDGYNCKSIVKASTLQKAHGNGGIYTY